MCIPHALWLKAYRVCSTDWSLGLTMPIQLWNHFIVIWNGVHFKVWNQLCVEGVKIIFLYGSWNAHPVIHPLSYVLVQEWWWLFQLYQLYLYKLLCEATLFLFPSILLSSHSMRCKTKPEPSLLILDSNFYRFSFPLHHCIREWEEEWWMVVCPTYHTLSLIRPLCSIPFHCLRWSWTLLFTSTLIPRRPYWWGSVKYDYIHSTILWHQVQLRPFPSFFSHIELTVGP